MEVFALWNGGGSYARGTVHDDLEKFPSIHAVEEALRDRYDSNGHRRVTFPYVRGEDHVYVPVVGLESYFEVWFSDPRSGAEPAPDRFIQFGPRGGVQIGQHHEEYEYR